MFYEKEIRMKNLKSIRLLLCTLILSVLCSAAVFAADGTETEPNDIFDSAEEIELNKEYAGTLSKNDVDNEDDVDWFKFTVPDQDQEANRGYFKIIFKNIEDHDSHYFEYFLSNEDNNSIYETSSISKKTIESPLFGFKGQKMYIKVGHSNMSVGEVYEYSVKIEYTLDPHFEAEDNGSIEKANSLGIGKDEKKQGNLYGIEDKDYFEFDVKTAGYYYGCLYHNHGDEYGSNKGYSATILDKDNSSVARIVTEKSGETKTDPLYLKAEKYYIMVDSVDDYRFDHDLQPYSVYVREVPENEAPDTDPGSENEGTDYPVGPVTTPYYEEESNDSADSANHITAGQTVYGSIEKGFSSGDNDWFSFELPEPGYFNVNFTGINGGTTDWKCLFNDKDRHTFYESNSFKQGEVSPNFGFEPQTIYIRIYASTLSKSDKDYCFTVNFTPDNDYEQEYNDTLATANSLTLGKRKQGTIHKNKSGNADVDYYKVDVPSSGDYSVHFYHNNGDMSMGWKVSPLDKDGSVIKNAKGKSTEFTAKESKDNSSEVLSLSAGTNYIKVTSSWSQTHNKPYFISLESGIGGVIDPEPVTEERDGGYTISHNSAIVFFGKTKKFKNREQIKKVFGDITVTWQGETYAAKSIKVSNKSGQWYIQVLKTESTSKNFNKGIKRLTKGRNGLKFTLVPLTISQSNGKSILEYKIKGNKLKKLYVKTNGPKKYKASKKKDYSYDASSKTITFKGTNLEGSYKI